MMNKVELIKIFEANMDELFDLSITNLSRESELYCNVKSSYKQGDLAKLRDLCVYIEANDFSFELKLITKIRLGIRERAFKQEEWIKELKRVDHLSVWQGEILFSLAYAFDFSKDYFMANKYYVKAHKALLPSCPKKSLLALHNAIAVQGSRYPEKRQFSDYQSLLKKAINQKNQKVIGLAQMNLSIEYQKTGAIYPAIERIDKAISAFESEVDSSQYYVAQAQKCDLLIDIGKYNQAEEILALMVISEHEFNKSSIFALKKRIAYKRTPHDEQDSTKTDIIFSPSFLQRRDAKKLNIKRPSLGKLESKFIDYLSSGPKNKIDIVTYLYGDNEDFFALEGRFKSLLSRLRKKIPFQINYFDGKYSIDGELEELSVIQKKNS